MSSFPGDFDPLQRLLSLKRHEQPPPGYFSHFSDKVMARIETEGLGMRGSWWRRLWSGLDARPLLTFGYGGRVVGLLLVGIGVLDSVEPGHTVTASVVANPWFQPGVEVGQSMFMDAASAHPAIARADSSSSVTPVISRTVPDSLFDVNRLRAQPASYTFR